MNFLYFFNDYFELNLIIFVDIFFSYTFVISKIKINYINKPNNKKLDLNYLKVKLF